MSAKQSNVKQNLINTCELAILTAIVFLFQMLGSFVHIGPTSVSLVLIPIVIGAIIIGPGAGAFLGFIFGFITLYAGISGTDPFTSALFNASPFFTSLLCIGKGTLCGLAAGLVYKPLGKKNTFAASVAAAATSPIVNTGIFILGGLFLLKAPLSVISGGQDVVYFLVIVCAGLNFIAEFAVNIVVSPAINTLVKALASRIIRK